MRPPAVQADLDSSEYFNPLIPSGMRRWEVNYSARVSTFQSTHPKRDETGSRSFRWSQTTNFNPLIPSGMRLHFKLFTKHRLTYFNPLIPSGMRLHHLRCNHHDQSYFNPLIPSGMRHRPDLLFYGRINFNPLIPSGMRQTLEYMSAMLGKISIHSSQAGWDLFPHFSFPFYFISIHSSQAGWDETLCVLRRIVDKKFQSTHPKRDETREKKKELSSFLFQSTHPKRDETSYFWLIIHNFTNFNPLIPSGMRPWTKYRSDPFRNDISIHSSQAGWDLSNGNIQVLVGISIHSSQAGWDAWSTGKWAIDFDISIHSSQAGWDKLSLFLMSGWLISIHSSQAGWDNRCFNDYADN